MKRKKLKTVMGILLSASMIISGSTPAAADSLYAGGKDASKQVENFIDALAATKNEKYSGNMKSSNAFDYMSEKSRKMALKSAENLPSRFDLRDRGVVTPVKNQGRLPICWTFGSIGASEISILSSSGTTYEKAKLDLSERHLAYFTYRHIPEDKNNPQAGEGVYWPEGEHDTSVLFSEGGTTYMPLHMFASGMGPVMESDVPYEGKNKLIREDWNGNPLEYSAGDDWTVSEKMRFKREYNLIEGNMLPQPVKYVTDKYGNTKYEYNEAATAAIKSELYQGRGVSASYANNWDKPYMDVYSDNPSQYAYEPGWPNHAILLVGWDDNYSKENFRTTFKGQTHEPEGDGAWIVRNSWGSGEQEFPNNAGVDFGIVNEDGVHTGYFYISYYDQSLNSDAGAFTFEFEKADSDNPEIINQHDFMLMHEFQWQLVDFKTRTSNIFTADEGQNVESVGVYTVHPQTKVNVKLYEMTDGATEPDEGFLVAEKTRTFDYGGFHRVNFDNSPFIAGGKKFSAVVTATVDTDEGTKYLYITNYGKNEKYYNTYGEWEGLPYYQRGIVNPGESYVYYEDDGKWRDYADVVEEWKAEEGNIYDFDNFNIKVYSKAASVSANAGNDKASIADASTNNDTASAVETSDSKDTANTTEATADKYDAAGSKEAQANNTADITDISARADSKKVSGLKVKKINRSKYLLSWNRLDGAVKYGVYYAKSKTGKFKKLAQTDRNSYQIKKSKKIKAGTKYLFKVKALGVSSDTAAVRIKK